MLIASDKRCALIKEMASSTDPKLDELINDLNLEIVELVLVEGFRHVPFHKIELHRPSTGTELIFPNDSNVIAVATDDIIDTGELPLLDINKPADIAMFIRDWMS